MVSSKIGLKTVNRLCKDHVQASDPEKSNQSSTNITSLQLVFQYCSLNPVDSATRLYISTIFLPSLIFAMSTLALLSCKAVWSAGRSWRRRVGSWSSGGTGDCGTGETGTVEADELGGADDGFKLPEPENDDWDWMAMATEGFSTWTDSVEGAERKISLRKAF